MFRTPISITPSDTKIDHQQSIFTIGSCFSDCMGHRFVENKFSVLSNPFGTVYNPVSISKLLSYTINNQLPNTNTYIETQGLYANFDFHSSFSTTKQPELEESIKYTLDKAHQFLSQTKWMIITLGTAYVFEKNEDHSIVSNCHKLPARLFTKRLLTQKQILAALSPILERLLEENQELNLILTVSPVRHIKDTLINNAVSKATLRITCETLATGHQRIQYFPSYEIMMDDLRDYRFYKADMIHPSNEAEQYIWEQFAKTYFTSETTELLNNWSKIKAAINHKPFNPASDKHQAFIRQTIDSLKQLGKKLNMSEELALMQSQLIK